MSSLSTDESRTSEAATGTAKPQVGAMAEKRRETNRDLVDLSIVIVTHNTRDLALACLRSVFDSLTHARYEVLLVDNDSGDGTVEAISSAFPDVRLIRNDANVGFAAANNKAIKDARGDHVLLLNPDTRINDDTLQTMLDYLRSHRNVGVVGCKVCLPDGSLDRACKRGFPTLWASLSHFLFLSRLFPRCAMLSGYQLSHLSDDDDHAVDSVSGCCMMVRRDAFERTGLLDDTFFMYGEDIDWCCRIKHAGWEIHYHPATRIIHYKGGSSNGRKSLRVIYEFYRAMALFYRKHSAPQRFMLTNALVYAGIGVLLCGAVLREGLRRIVGR